MTNPTTNTDSPSQRGAGLQGSPGVLDVSGSLTTALPPHSVPGGTPSTAEAGEAPGRAYSLEAVEALERRCDELQAQVASLRAAAVIRAGIIEDQARRIHRTDALLAEASSRLEAGGAAPGGAAQTARAALSQPAARIVRVPARTARRYAAALARRLRS